MKIYIILMLFGEVGGTWGPIPNDMTFCVNHAAEFVSITNDNYARGGPPLQYEGREATLADFTIGCVELDPTDRPELGVKFDPTRLTQPGIAFGKPAS